MTEKKRLDASSLGLEFARAAAREVETFIRTELNGRRQPYVIRSYADDKGNPLVVVTSTPEGIRELNGRFDQGMEIALRSHGTRTVNIVSRPDGFPNNKLN